MSAPSAKSLSRGSSQDMSPDAIMYRLRIVDELYQLGKLLSKAQFLGKVEDLKRADRVRASLNGDPAHS